MNPICDDENYIRELKEKFGNETFQRVVKVDGMYVTSDISRNTSNNWRIFRETQKKRLLRSGYSPFVPTDIKRKLSYFSQDEDNNESGIYLKDSAEDLHSTESYAIQNIGHATQLIQIPKFNILTDPVFNDLNGVLYPEKTKSYPHVENLPQNDVIIISHNHRDHVDESSLQKIQQCHRNNGWEQPLLLVPMGDKSLLQNIGFDQVVEVEWFTKISITKSTKAVNFISIPSDHRSGRNLTDHHKSLATGWIINPRNDNVIFKFSGDTRPLTHQNQKATDCVLWNEIKQKEINQGKSDEDTQIPDIVFFEPSGPNYTRCDMEVTHQSTAYSVLLKFIEAQNLSKLSGRNETELLNKMKTIMMHHNKFEFGPDRFNEGLFILKKLLNYLDLNETQLESERVRQENKLENNTDRMTLIKCLRFTSRPLISTLPEKTSLLVRAKDFIINDMKLVASELESFDKERIKEYIISSTVFPKIGERFNNEKLDNFEFDVGSINKYHNKSAITAYYLTSIQEKFLTLQQ